MSLCSVVLQQCSYCANKKAPPFVSRLAHLKYFMLTESFCICQAGVIYTFQYKDLLFYSVVD